MGPFRLNVSVREVPSVAGPASGGPCAPAAGDLQLRRRIHGELLEHLDLASLDLLTTPAEVLRPRVHDALRKLCAAAHAPTAWVDELLDEVLGLGPLQPLLGDPTVSEIMVVDAETIYVERSGRIERSARRFTDHDAVRSALERIVAPMGRRIDEASPCVDARLPDGSRVHAIIPPLALRGPCITIRKFRGARLSYRELVSAGSMDDAMADFLDRSVRARKNIVIAGGTGSGKTTLLNVLSASIPSDQRIVTIEDAAELQLAQEHVVALETRPANLEGHGEVSIRELVRNALRMRPDRIVVGECRGAETLDMLQAMNTGHAGSMTTTHANSPHDALSRLEMLCLLSGVELPLAALRRQLATAIDLIVQQQRHTDGTRRITAISEVCGVDDGGQLTTAEVFRYLPATETAPGRFMRCGHLASFAHELDAIAPAECGS